MPVGANIRKRRFELKMSQQELAEAMGYRTRSTIAKIESGENDVSHKKLLRFAQVLQTTPAELMDLSPVAEQEQTPRGERSEQGRCRTVAVLLAGGKSARNLMNIPNQFIDVLGKPVIVYCMEAYQKHPAVDDIYVVCLKGWETIVKAYAERYGITKLRELIPAGTSGILSVKNAVERIGTLYGPEDNVIIQESTRPMVSAEMISNLLRACTETGSANICHSMEDYVQFSVKDGKPEYLDRSTVVDIQSPEIHRLSVIRAVFRTAEERKHPLTESCTTMLMYNLGKKIHFIEGGINNIKIVRQEDIAVFVSLLRNGI